jgi:diacylglycerol kinase family enzyme
MNEHRGVQVIATTISGSVSDWRKVERIVPLFEARGRSDVVLHTVDTHGAARERTRELVADGCTDIISAGGSGTFNAVLEGCIDAGTGLAHIRLGFLRKGSADLIGKVLGMPDEIEAAIDVFAASLAHHATVPCDVIRAESAAGSAHARHFVGYGGAGIFGRIPHYTENRYIKYYKGVLSQLFGDLGPFFVGASLSSVELSTRGLLRRRPAWTISVDGAVRAEGRYQALIIVNGDLGDDLPFARGVPLGSGDFHLFALRDVGLRRLPGQFHRAFDSTIQHEPERWGFEHHRIDGSLVLAPSDGSSFPVNVDGSTLRCEGAVSFRIVDRIRLMARAAAAAEADAPAVATAADMAVDPAP